MANFSVNGLDELMLGLEDVANTPDEIILEMLTAEAEVVAEEQKKGAEALAGGQYARGITKEKITFSKELKPDKLGRRCIYVYPQGTRTDTATKRSGGSKRRAAEVAYINEYGAEKTKGIKARPFIRAANEKAVDAAQKAAAQVYDRFLKSKNL